VSFRVVVVIVVVVVVVVVVVRCLWKICCCLPRGNVSVSESSTLRVASRLSTDGDLHVSQSAILHIDTNAPTALTIRGCLRVDGTLRLSDLTAGAEGERDIVIATATKGCPAVAPDSVDVVTTGVCTEAMVEGITQDGGNLTIRVNVRNRCKSGVVAACSILPAVMMGAAQIVMGWD